MAAYPETFFVELPLGKMNGELKFLRGGSGAYWREKDDRSKEFLVGNTIQKNVMKRTAFVSSSRQDEKDMEEDAVETPRNRPKKRVRNRPKKRVVEEETGQQKDGVDIERFVVS